jgi:hypothetical protein
MTTSLTKSFVKYIAASFTISTVYAAPNETPSAQPNFVEIGTFDGIPIRTPSPDDLHVNPLPEVATALSLGKAAAPEIFEKIKEYKIAQKFLPKDSLLVELISQNAGMLASLPLAFYKNLEKASLIGFAKKYGLAQDLKSSDELTDAAQKELRNKLESLFAPKTPVTDDLARKFGGTIKVQFLRIIPGPESPALPQKHTLEHLLATILSDIKKGKSFKQIANEKSRRYPHFKVLFSEENLNLHSGYNVSLVEKVSDFSPLLNAKEGQITTIKISDRHVLIPEFPIQLDYDFFGLGTPKDRRIIIGKVLKFSPLSPAAYKTKASALKTQYQKIVAQDKFQDAFSKYKSSLPVKLNLPAIQEIIDPFVKFTQESSEFVLTPGTKPGTQASLAYFDNLLVDFLKYYAQLTDIMYKTYSAADVEADPVGTRLMIPIRAIVAEFIWPMMEDFKTPLMRNLPVDYRIENLRSLTLTPHPARTHFELAKMLALKNDKEAYQQAAEYLKRDGLTESTLLPLDKPTLENRVQKVEALLDEIKAENLADEEAVNQLKAELKAKKEEALKSL